MCALSLTTLLEKDTDTISFFHCLVIFVLFCKCENDSYVLSYDLLMKIMYANAGIDL